jgi:hypothetical protein
VNISDLLDQWQRIAALPAVVTLLAILRKVHPLRLLQRFFSFGIGVSERTMMLATIDSLRQMCDSETQSGLRWKAKYDQCVIDLKAADEENAALRIHRGVSAD